MIYFAQLPTGAIKIGYSADVDQRRQGLRQHYGCDVEILHVIPGSMEDERSLHERFAHLRFGRTEQFRPGPDLVAFIGRPLGANVTPDKVEAHPPVLDGVPVKLDAEVYWHAKLIASHTKQRVSDLLAEILRPALLKMEQDEVLKRNKLFHGPKSTRGGKE